MWRKRWFAKSWIMELETYRNRKFFAEVPIENPIDPKRLITVTCFCIKAKCWSCQSYVMMEKLTILQLLGMCCFWFYLALFSIFSKYWNNIFTSSSEFSIQTLKKYVKFGFFMYYFPFSGLLDERVSMPVYLCFTCFFDENCIIWPNHVYNSSNCLKINHIECLK